MTNAENTAASFDCASAPRSSMLPIQSAVANQRTRKCKLSRSWQLHGEKLTAPLEHKCDGEIGADRRQSVITVGLDEHLGSRRWEMERR